MFMANRSWTLYLCVIRHNKNIKKTLKKKLKK